MTKNQTREAYTVRKQPGAGRGQYAVFDSAGNLVEGGFFSRSAAEECAAEYNTPEAQ